jgi:hypothetical protein
MCTIVTTVLRNRSVPPTTIMQVWDLCLWSAFGPCTWQACTCQACTWQIFTRQVCILCSQMPCPPKIMHIHAMHAYAVCSYWSKNKLIIDNTVFKAKLVIKQTKLILGLGMARFGFQICWPKCSQLPAPLQGHFSTDIVNSKFSFVIH